MKVYVAPSPNETKWQSMKRKAKEKALNLWEWSKDNKEWLIIVVPAVAGVAATTIKVVGKRINLHKQKNVKDLYCYDRSLGHYWALRRELTNQEWLEIDRRRKMGERLADILASFNVLK